MADAKAYTSTADVAGGNPVDVTQVTTGAGVVERQRVALADPQGLSPDVRPTSTGALPIDTSTDTLFILEMQRQTKLLRAILMVLSHLHAPALNVSEDLSVFDDQTVQTL